jgi:TonB-dependent Receptor Plug Domain.
MKKLLLFILLLGSFTAFSQGTVTGTLMDSDSGNTLPSANVIETGTMNGTVADMDGNFTLNVTNNQGTVTVSYVGYTSKKMSYTLVNGTVNLGSISLDLDSDALSEVVIIGKGVIDLAGGRATPVAVTTISSEEIQRKGVGNVEVSEIIKNSPSIHVSGESGFGDSQMYLRGFEQITSQFC